MDKKKIVNRLEIAGVELSIPGLVWNLSDSLGSGLDADSIKQLLNSYVASLLSELSISNLGVAVVCTSGIVRSRIVALNIESEGFDMLTPNGYSMTAFRSATIDMLDEDDDYPYGIPFVDLDQDVSAELNLLVLAVDEIDAMQNESIWKEFAMFLQTMQDKIENFRIIVVIGDEFIVENLFKIKES